MRVRETPLYRVVEFFTLLSQSVRRLSGDRLMDIPLLSQKGPFL